jgi:hypothetical protein
MPCAVSAHLSPQAFSNYYPLEKAPLYSSPAVLVLSRGCCSLVENSSRKGVTRFAPAHLLLQIDDEASVSTAILSLRRSRKHANGVAGSLREDEL